MPKSPINSPISHRNHLNAMRPFPTVAQTISFVPMIHCQATVFVAVPQIWVRIINIKYNTLIDFLEDGIQLCQKNKILMIFWIIFWSKKLLKMH
jgi:hypothetical protein